MIRQRGAEHQGERRFACVDSLEETAAEHPVVNDGGLHHATSTRRGIDASPPNPTAEVVEIFRVFLRQRGFGFAIAGLLLQVGCHGRATEMPNNSGMAEPQFSATLLDAPAEIHVVPGLAENGIKSLHAVQYPF